MKRRALIGCEMSAQVRDAFAAMLDENGEPVWDEVWSADVLPCERPSRVIAQGSVFQHCAPEFPDEPKPRGCHYQGDVLDLFDWDHPVNRERALLSGHLSINGDIPLWDAALLHPPCTDLSQAGAVWWKRKRATPSEIRPPEIPDEEFFSVQDYAAWFFMQCVNAPAPLVAVENPRGDMSRRYRPPDQYVQPHMFGDPLIKATGWWLKGLPLLYADNPVTPAGRVATGGGSWRVDMKNGRDREFASGHEDKHGRINRQRERNRTLPGMARAMAEQWTAFVLEQEKQAA